MDRLIQNKYPNYHEHIGANSFFPIGEAFWWGTQQVAHIDSKINGWILTTPFDAGILAQTIYIAGDGDYLEIGTAWGGSAVLAALTKKRFNIAGKVVSIDPIIGDEAIIPLEMQPNGRELIINNFKAFEVDDIAHFRHGKFDLKYFEDCKFNIVLVDGDHNYKAVKHDWAGAKQLSTRYIIAHDYAHYYKNDVCRAIKENMEGWEFVNISGLSAVLEKQQR